MNDGLVFNFFFKGRFSVPSIRCFGKCDPQIKRLLEDNKGNYYHLHLITRHPYKLKKQKFAADKFYFGGFPGQSIPSSRRWFVWSHNVQALSARRALEIALKSIHNVELNKVLRASNWWFCNVISIDILE